jgi:hypothetical protein
MQIEGVHGWASKGFGIFELLASKGKFLLCLNMIPP